MNSNPSMDTVEEVRRRKLAMLKDEHGTWAALNRALGRSSRDATLNQIANRSKDSKTGQVRELGRKQARDIEQILGKPTGWLDRPTDAMLAVELGLRPSMATLPSRPSPAQIAAGLSAAIPDQPPNASPAPNQPVIGWESPDELPPGQVLVQRRAIRFAAGNGKLMFEDEHLPPLAFRDEYLRERRVRNRDNLVICYAEGDSMEPTFSDGDVLLCDTGQTEVIDGQVYAIDYGGSLRVKRLRKRFDGGLLIQSDNALKHPPESLDATQAVYIKVLGRVLWRGGSV